MKQVIDGKSYDTDTADLLVHWHNGHNHGDFHRCEEDLYRTKKGNYFIHGEGGALSAWSEPCGNCRGGGSGIKALSPAEALEWIEERNEDVPEDCPEIAALVTEA